MENQTELVIKSLQQEREELIKEIESIDRLLAKYRLKASNKQYSFVSGSNINETAVNSSPKGVDYSKHSFRDMIMLILKEKQRFLHKREILEYIRELNPNIDEKFDETIVNYLRSLKEKGKLDYCKFNNIALYTFWGSPKWLDDNKNPKPEYMYKLDAISSSAKENGNIEL